MAYHLEAPLRLSVPRRWRRFRPWKKTAALSHVHVADCRTSLPDARGNPGIAEGGDKVDRIACGVKGGDQFADMNRRDIPPRPCSVASSGVS
jgi:hypothetical protein